MDTPAAVLMRRTEIPSWPYFFKHPRVASTRASRRSAGVARRNFGTCRFFFILYAPELIELPSWSSAAKRLRCSVRSIIQSQRASDRLVRQLAGVHVQTLSQSWVLPERRAPSVVRQRLDVRQGGIGEGEGGGSGNRSRHVGNRIVDDAVQHIRRFHMSSRTAGLKTASLIDCNVHQHGTGFHG